MPANESRMSTTRGAARLVGVLASALGLISLAPTRGLAQGSGEEAASGAIRIADARADVAERRVAFSVSGEADLPAGTVLVVSVSYAGERCLAGEAPVGARGEFACALGPFDQVALPGAYTLRVELLREAQPREIASRLPPAGGADAAAEREVRVGDVAAETAIRERCRQGLLAALERMRIVHRQVAMWGAYTLESVRMEHASLGPGLPEETVRRLARQWDRFSEDRYRRTFGRASDDLHAVRGGVLASPLPVAERGVLSIRQHVVALYSSYTRAIRQELGLPVAAEIVANALYDPDTTIDRTRELAIPLYEMLGATEAPEWGPVDLANAERGADAQGDTFRSTVSKFEITKPGAGWVFVLPRSHPAIRLHIRRAAAPGASTGGAAAAPAEGEARAQSGDLVSIAVQLNDFAMVNTDQETDLALEELTVARDGATRMAWGGFREVERAMVWSPDPTMRQQDHGRAGYRRGLDVTFTAVVRGEAYQIRQHSLYCRWMKRTYDVVCAAPREQFEELERVFQQVIETFHVHDEPVPDVPEDE